MAIEPGRVYVFEPDEAPPPTSTLADAFFAKDGLLAEAIVLRGYLGRSPILQRANQYLTRAKESVADKGGDVSSIVKLIGAIDSVTEPAKPHIPWRIYLTPSLDRYVDFHLSALLAWRQEPKAERQDTYTVWLRGYSPEGAPLSYRIVEETIIGPSFSAYLGGDLVDDYLGQPGSQSAAWENQASLYGGGKVTTTRKCGE